MIEIPNRFTGEIIFRSETANTVREAVFEMIQLARDAGALVILNGAELNGAQLNNAELNGAQLNNAQLNNAQLNNAQLNNAELNYAELNYAELNYAQLSGAQLNGAELNNAELNYAELNYAQLSGAQLNNAQLSRAELNGANIISLGYDPRGYHFLLYFEGEKCVIRAGCRCFDFAQAREHWVDNPDALARVNMAEKLAMSRGWLKEDLNNGK